MAEAREFSDHGRSVGGTRPAVAESSAAAQSRSATGLCARLASGGSGTGAPSLLCDPVVVLRCAGAAVVRLYELAQAGAMSAPASVARPKRSLLLLLVLLFFTPLLLAFLMYYGSDWRPTGRTNHGVLIVPARTLPQVELPQVALAQVALPQIA